MQLGKARDEDTHQKRKKKILRESQRAKKYERGKTDHRTSRQEQAAAREARNIIVHTSNHDFLFTRKKGGKPHISFFHSKGIREGTNSTQLEGERQHREP